MGRVGAYNAGALPVAQIGGCCIPGKPIVGMTKPMFPPGIKPRSTSGNGKKKRRRRR